MKMPACHAFPLDSRRSARRKCQRQAGAPYSRGMEQIRKVRSRRPDGRRSSLTAARMGISRRMARVTLCLFIYRKSRGEVRYAMPVVARIMASVIHRMEGKMPQLIENIDAIARRKGRDVLFLSFPKYSRFKDRYAHHDDSKVRQRVIAWLDQAGISWQECAFPGFYNYTGDIYVDVPFDTTNADYRKLAEFLETPDGKMKIEGVSFYYLPLEKAMQYKHHDEPGHREEQAEEW
jgi:hypothetical protein